MVEQAAASLFDNDTSKTVDSDMQQMRLNLIKKKLFGPELELAQNRFDQKILISSAALKQEMLEAMKKTEVSVNDRVCMIEEVLLQLESL